MEGNETIFYSGPGADLLRIAAYLGLFGIGLDLPTLSETQSVPFTYLSGDITCFDWSRLSLLPPIDIVNCWNVLADNPSLHLLRTLGFPSYGRQYQTARKAALPQLLELEGHVLQGIAPYLAENALVAMGWDFYRQKGPELVLEKACSWKFNSYR